MTILGDSRAQGNDHEVPEVVGLPNQPLIHGDAPPASTASAGPVRRSSPKGQQIGSLIKRIRELQQQASKSKLAVLRARLKIGETLIELKNLAGHGRWIKVRDQLGYDERTAQRLMVLPGTVLADQIRAAGPDFGVWLPVDLRKLHALARLPAERLQQAFDAKWPLEEMTRKDVADAVKAMELPDADVQANGHVQDQSTSSGDVDAQEADSQVNEDLRRTPRTTAKTPSSKSGEHQKNGDRLGSSPSARRQPAVELNQPPPTIALQQLIAACAVINDELKGQVIAELAGPAVDRRVVADAFAAVTAASIVLSELHNLLARGDAP